jgi:hypothetical protein
MELPFVTICNHSFSMYHCGSILHRGEGKYPSLRHPDWFLGLSKLLFNRYGGIFPAGLKRPGRKADHWTQVWLELYADCPICLLGGHRGERWPLAFNSKVELKEKYIPVQRLACWRVFRVFWNTACTDRTVGTIVACSLYHCSSILCASLMFVYVWRLCFVLCDHILVTKSERLPYS